MRLNAARLARNYFRWVVSIEKSVPQARKLAFTSPLSANAVIMTALHSTAMRMTTVDGFFMNHLPQLLLTRNLGRCCAQCFSQFPRLRGCLHEPLRSRLCFFVQSLQQVREAL